MRKLCIYVVMNNALFLLTMQRYGKNLMKTRKAKKSYLNCCDTPSVLRQRGSKAAIGVNATSVSRF